LFNVPDDRLAEWDVVFTHGGATQGIKMIGDSWDLSFNAADVAKERRAPRVRLDEVFQRGSFLIFRILARLVQRPGRQARGMGCRFHARRSNSGNQDDRRGRTPQLQRSRCGEGKTRTSCETRRGIPARQFPTKRLQPCSNPPPRSPVPLVHRPCTPTQPNATPPALRRSRALPPPGSPQGLRRLSRSRRQRQRGFSRSRYAYPAQCNATGARLGLRYAAQIKHANSNAKILVDAAAYTRSVD
jgi:hypothetical protein